MNKQSNEATSTLLVDDLSLFAPLSYVARHGCDCCGRCSDASEQQTLFPPFCSAVRGHDGWRRTRHDTRGGNNHHPSTHKIRDEMHTAKQDTHALCMIKTVVFGAIPYVRTYSSKVFLESGLRCRTYLVGERRGNICCCC